MMHVMKLFEQTAITKGCFWFQVLAYDDVVRQGLDLLSLNRFRRSRRADDQLSQRRLFQAHTEVSGRLCGPSFVAGGRDEVERQGRRSALELRFDDIPEMQ